MYAPDYVANAGGVIWLAGYETLGWDDAHMRGAPGGDRADAGRRLRIRGRRRDNHGGRPRNGRRSRIRPAEHSPSADRCVGDANSMGASRFLDPLRPADELPFAAETVEA